MANIEETKDVLELGIALINATGKSIEDGKFDLTDVANYIPALLKLPDAFTDINKVGEELRDLDEAEKNELQELVITQLDIPQDEVENTIERIFKFVTELYLLVKDLFPFKGGNPLK